MPSFNPYRYGKDKEQKVELTSESTGGGLAIANTADQQIDPATEQTLAALADALDSQSVDEMRVDLTQQSGPAVATSATIAAWNAGTLSVEQATPVGVEDSTGTQVDPATDTTLTNTLSRSIAAWNAGTLPTEQQTPVGVEDSTGTQVDPAENLDGASTSAAAAGTGSANAATITVPDGCRTVTVGYDTAGAANITVEVSPDSGTTWYPLNSYAPASATANADTLETGFDDVRAYIDSNLNSLHIGAKGV